MHTLHPVLAVMVAPNEQLLQVRNTYYAVEYHGADKLSLVTLQRLITGCLHPLDILIVATANNTCTAFQCDLASKSQPFITTQ